MQTSQSEHLKNWFMICLQIIVYVMCVAIFGIAQVTSNLGGVVLMLILIWISVVDFTSYRIPNLASVILLLTGLIQLFLWRTDAAFLTIVGGVIWPLIFWGLAFCFEKIRGRTGLGFGDVKLIAGLAIWVGLQGSVMVVLMASVAGVSTILIRFLLCPKRGDSLTTMHVAFGPFLCFFTWIVWLQGMN
jgi:prepilin signal peptidase PulO-like enzyme (type II secretory pathway)